MTYAVLSSRAPAECVNNLKALGYTTLLLPSFKRLSFPVDTHADMLFFSYKDQIVTHKEYLNTAKSIFDILEESCKINIIQSDHDVKSKYPFDIAFNAIAAGNHLYTNEKHTSAEIIKAANSEGLSISSVKQGYAACSTLLLRDSHVITADVSLAKKFRENGLEVILISNGSISLPPYDYGFIGGASGVFEDTVYFAGDIESHPDRYAILNAVSKCKMKHISLSKEKLCDIGGIKFFVQK